MRTISISTDRVATAVIISEYLDAVAVPHTRADEWANADHTITYRVSVPSRHQEDAILGLQRRLFSYSLGYTLTFSIS